MDAVRPTFPLPIPRLRGLLQRHTWLWPVGASLVLIALTAIPYLYGAMSAPADRAFSGIVYNVHDTAQYLSWMRESRTAFLIENRLTSEPNPAIFLNLHWWLPGRLAAVFGLSTMQVYHIYRLVTIPFCVWVIYWLSGLVLSRQRERLLAFLLTIAASGFGWVWVVHKYALGLPDVAFPTDIYTAPSNTFFTFLVSPHLTLSLGLTLWALGLGWLAYHHQSWRYTLAAGAVSLFLGLGHIYDLVTVWSVLAAFGFFVLLRDGIRRSIKTFFMLAGIVVLSLPAVAYFGYVSSNANLIWQQALAQYDNLNSFTPDPAHLIILLGLPFVISLLTYRGLLPLREQDERYLFIAAWFLANLLIIYLPLKFRVMLLAGLQFPLAVLTSRALYNHIMPWLAEQVEASQQPWSGRLRLLIRWTPIVLLLLVIPANLYIFGWRMLDMHRADYPFFLYQDDLAAMQWLEANADREDVILSSFTIGHYLPGLTGARPYLSNAVMTANYVQKREQVHRFFAAEMTLIEQCTFLQRQGIDYLFYGPAEKELGHFDPSGQDLFTPVFERDQTTVHRISLKGCE